MLGNLAQITRSRSDSYSNHFNVIFYLEKVVLKTSNNGAQLKFFVHRMVENLLQILRRTRFFNFIQISFCHGNLLLNWGDFL